VGLDAALGGSSNVTDALADGPAALAGDLADRLEISLRRTLALGPALVSLASLAALAVVATRRPRGAVTDALLVALAVSLLVNDTPVDVLSVGAVSALAAWRFETAAGARPHGARLDWRRMRRPATFLALLLALVALVAVGCGGEDTTATPETVVGELPEETVEEGNEDLPALDLTGDAAAGESIFASEGCGGCHVLAAAGANGQVGPSLDDGQSYELIVERVTLGQGAMPAFADDLSAQQIADVSQYVADNSSG
jgi:mono/diheme cytochrome c family protein